MIDLYPIAGPLLRRLDPETAHGVTIAALKSGMAPRSRMRDDPILRSSLWGLDFANPVGLAAGFDKNAEVADAMLAQGFGFVEIGSVTPRPQPGNPRPRAFRVPEAKAMINRYGFNNDGLDVVAGRLEARRGRPGLVGANVGKNKETVDAAADYVIGIRRLAPLASYLVINVSSPNTPGLRALQGREPLAELLDRALDARAASDPGGWQGAAAASEDSSRPDRRGQAGHRRGGALQRYRRPDRVQHHHRPAAGTAGRCGRRRPAA